MSSDSNSDSAKSTINTRPRQRAKMAEHISNANAGVPSIPHDLKIPPFWPEKPAIWFAQVEGQFAIRRITDNATKFYHILASLDRQCAAEIEDILIGPPNYDNLKMELIKRLSVSRENKVKQLLMHEELGTRKPSQFLRHLQHLAGPKVPEDFLKTIWMSRLPTAMQPIIASQPTLPLSALAELADRINDIAPPTQQVAALASASTSSSIDELTNKVAELTKQVSALTTMVNQRSRRRERERAADGYKRDRSSSRRSASSYRRFPVCWYHHKFGAEARRCIKPCDYTAGNDPGSR